MIRKIESTKAYKTTDGKLFSTEDEAERHQKRLDFIESLSRSSGGLYDFLGESMCLDENDMAAALLESKNRVLNLLLTEKELAHLSQLEEDEVNK